MGSNVAMILLSSEDSISTIFVFVETNICMLSSEDTAIPQINFIWFEMLIWLCYLQKIAVSQIIIEIITLLVEINSTNQFYTVLNVGKDYAIFRRQ